MTPTILVMDGQGGRLGALAVQALRETGSNIPFELIAVGTNSAATAAMLKAGADAGATGENPARVCTADADVIIAPVGMVIADSMLGEVTPEIARCVGASRALKLLIPWGNNPKSSPRQKKCHSRILGVSETDIAVLAKQAAEEAIAFLREMN